MGSDLYFDAIVLIDDGVKVTDTINHACHRSGPAGNPRHRPEGRRHPLRGRPGCALQHRRARAAARLHLGHVAPQW